MLPVDVLTVVPPGGTVEEPVLKALRDQGEVAIEHHIVEGPRPIPGERRAATIARARNRAKAHGTAHYAMFLDSDVVLPARGIQALVYGLVFHPHYGALGINYQDAVEGPAEHVAMGAVLFLRPVLARVRFRVEPGLCECACCCRDIRRMGYLIDYVPGLRAEHLKGP